MIDDALINLKDRFPFRLATTSYILPEAIMPNLRLLGPLFDEVELVLFDSRHPDDLPTTAAITEMAALARELRFTYNVHLPKDIHLGSLDDSERRQACETILRYYEHTRALDPTAYILHLERNPNDGDGPASMSTWRDLLRKSLAWLLDRGLPREITAIENIDYPFSWVDILVDEFKLKICLDLGHLIMQEAHLPLAFNRYQERASMMHLHGIGSRDHQAITLIPHDVWIDVSQILRHFHGGLSLEVFSLRDLRDSLTRMAELC